MVSVVATGRGWRQPVFLLITGVLGFILVKDCGRVNQRFECYFTLFLSGQNHQHSQVTGDQVHVVVFRVS